MVGARTFPGNPYDGHILSQQLEQTAILLEDTGKAPKTVVVDLGFRGVDHDNPQVEIIHRGKYKSLTRQQRRWLRRRQVVEPAIGHLKSDHRMDRCWLQGQLGDALHVVLCAVGYNLRWLLRAMARLGLSAHFFAPDSGRSAGALCLCLSTVGQPVGRCDGLGGGGGTGMNFAGPTNLTVLDIWCSLMPKTTGTSGQVTSQQCADTQSQARDGGWDVALRPLGFPEVCNAWVGQVLGVRSFFYPRPRRGAAAAVPAGSRRRQC